jgi:hypothetical protein
VPVNKRVIGWLVGQFHRPHGIGGHLAGWVMAHRCSNRRRNRWVVSLLGVQPAGRVLEIGFGPGIAIAELGWLATRGQVYGAGHSAVLVSHSTRKRCRYPVRTGRSAGGFSRGPAPLRRALGQDPGRQLDGLLATATGAAQGPPGEAETRGPDRDRVAAALPWRDRAGLPAGGPIDRGGTHASRFLTDPPPDPRPRTAGRLRARGQRRAPPAPSPAVVIPPPA